MISLVSKLIGTLEAFAVFGILTLYALEFSGIETVSSFFPDMDVQELGTLSFEVGRDTLQIQTASLIILVSITIIAIAYFAFLRPGRRK